MNFFNLSSKTGMSLSSTNEIQTRNPSCLFEPVDFRVIVEIPTTLDKKQLKALEEFSKSTDESKNFPGTDQFKKVFKELD